MIMYTNSAIGEGRKVCIPIQVTPFLNLKDNELLKVKMESDYIVMTPFPHTGLDEELFEELVHTGILMDFK